MGEEEKKPEEKKEVGVEEKKDAAAAAAKKPEEEEAAKKPAEEEKKTEETKETEQSTPPPPEEIILRVFMHCEGCARKVKKCLKGFQGVEDVQTDCKTHNVTVKGKKADPLKVLERLQRKSHRKVELLTPIPKPPPDQDEKKSEENAQPAADQQKKQEVVIITVVLKVHMHCEACAQEIRKRILRMKGVQSADPDLKGSQITVKGVFDPPKLVEYVYKRTGKHAFIVKTEILPEKKNKEEEEEEEEEENKGKEEKTEGEEKTTEEKKQREEEKKEEDQKKEDQEAAKQDDEGTAAAAGGGGGGAAAATEEETEKVEVVELKKNEFCYYPPKYNMEYEYPPQIFSDENPNACSIM